MATADPEEPNPYAAPSTFAHEIKRRRIELGLALKGAARRCGVGEQRWRQIEKGFQLENGERRPTRPSSDWVISVARGFRWDIREALTLAGYDPDEIVIPKDQTIEPPAGLVDDWNKLNSQQQQVVKDLVTLFVDPEAIIQRPAPTQHNVRTPLFIDPPEVARVHDRD